MKNQFSDQTLIKNQYDLYILELQEDKSEAILVVELQNGELIYGDDGNTNYPERSFWKRLKSKNPEIHNIYIKFRTEKIQPFPANQKAYFFCKSIFKSLHNDEKSIHFFKLGKLLDNNEFLIKTYKVPELILFEEETRIVEENSENIIWNKK